MSATAIHRDELLTVRGTRVHLLSAGSGAPVLYLHGAGATDAWLPFHARLAARCHRQLKEPTRRLGGGTLLGLLQMGTMTHWEPVRNLELFAREVMPRLRAAQPAAATS